VSRIPVTSHTEKTPTPCRGHGWAESLVMVRPEFKRPECRKYTGLAYKPRKKRSQPQRKHRHDNTAEARGLASTTRGCQQQNIARPPDQEGKHVCRSGEEKTEKINPRGLTTIRERVIAKTGLRGDHLRFRTGGKGRQEPEGKPANIITIHH